MLFRTNTFRFRHHLEITQHNPSEQSPSRSISGTIISGHSKNKKTKKNLGTKTSTLDTRLLVLLSSEHLVNSLGLFGVSVLKLEHPIEQNTNSDKFLILLPLMKVQNSDMLLVSAYVYCPLNMHIYFMESFTCQLSLHASRISICCHEDTSFH
jgi:hypothetical protein